jgi:hypothetical protein
MLKELLTALDCEILLPHCGNSSNVLCLLDWSLERRSLLLRHLYSLFHYRNNGSLNYSFEFECPLTYFLCAEDSSGGISLLKSVPDSQLHTWIMHSLFQDSPAAASSFIQGDGTYSDEVRNCFSYLRMLLSYSYCSLI